MANIRYFAEHNGEAVELSRVWHDGHVSTKPHHFFGFAPDGTKLQAQRKITYKSNPSKHECNAKCMNAHGTGSCECRCGGKNHGRGGFVAEAV